MATVMYANNMKKLLLVFAILAAAPGCTRTVPLRVMSYNVRLGVARDSLNHWDLRKIATPAMLNEVRPAVFGVQEAYDFQIKYILDECPRYKAIGVGREDGVSAGEHMSVFYDTTRISLLDWGTYWLSETPDVPSMGWDAACKRTATWSLLRDSKTGREFYLVNTHLDHIGKVARREGLALIYNRIREMNPEGRPMVLTGDFNILPDDEGLTDLNSLMLSARFNSRQADSIGSFNGFECGPLRPLDYIYFCGFRQSIRFTVDTTTYAGVPFISDHYPVYADLVFD